MQISIDDIAHKLVAIACKKGSEPRRTGTAFWADVNGTERLLTVGHVPWKQLTDKPPSPAPTSEIIDVQWWMMDGSSGRGDAKFFSYPSNNLVDYAYFIFTKPKHAPPKKLFSIDVNTPNKPTPIAVVGFPEVLNPNLGSALQFGKAVGNVEAHYKNSFTQILVSGSADYGYSGGPAFRYLGEDMAEEEVIGLMQGRPKDKILANYGLVDGFVLFGAASFV